MLDFDRLDALWHEEPETFGNKARCASAADAMGLVPREFKEDGWTDRFWNVVTDRLFKKPSGDSAPQRALFVRCEQGEFWKPTEMCGFDEVAMYVAREIMGQIAALHDKRDAWDAYCERRFGRGLTRFAPSAERDPDLSYDDAP